MDDQTAIRRLKQGKIDGLEVLVKRYQLQAGRAAYLVTQDEALAQDATQEAFLRAYRYIGQFDLNRPFAPWLIRIVVNVAVQLSRRRDSTFADHERHQGEAAFEEEAFLEQLPDPALSPEGMVEAAELRAMVWTALQSLSPDQRALVVLRYYYDFSEQELATTMNAPRGTISWRLSTARKRLEVLLRFVVFPSSPTPPSTN